MIACTHPGKIGDALYALPTVRALAQRHGCLADFYTSEYCRPMLNLVRAQPYIRNAAVALDYVPERTDCGVQPCEVPTPAGYEAVYHLGFKTGPDRPLNEFIAEQAGVAAKDAVVQYDFPDPKTYHGRYLVLAARGASSYADLFRAVIDLSPLTVVEVGSAGEYVGGGRSLDLAGLDMLDVLPWLAGASGFVGLSSAMLVLANGFPAPKVVPHDGKSWDQRHWLRSPANHYPVDPSAADVLRLLGLSPGRQSESFSKTYDPADRFDESALVEDVRRQLVGVPHRFEHPLRAWEYGLVLHALRAHGCRSVLDVGGGGSVFAQAAAALDIDVTQVDPGDCASWVAAQSKRTGRSVTYHQVDAMQYEGEQLYDAVTCLSVLEHIDQDYAFFQRLQSFVKPGGLLAVTVDFWPDGAPQVAGHLRTYDIGRLSRLADSAPGFELLGPPDYTDHGTNVYGYTFASLVMRRGT